MQHRNRHPTTQKYEPSHNPSTPTPARTGKHIRKPKGSDEAPRTPDNVDEDADGSCVLDVAVDGVGDEDGGDDLVTDCCYC